MSSRKLNAITDEGAILSDRQGKEELLRADNVVLACGMKPINALAKELEGKVKEMQEVRKKIHR